MNEVQMTELDLSSLGERSVPTGKIKYVPSVLACYGLGIYFPGVQSCLPVVIWTPNAPFALAMHVASPINTPDELKAEIADFKRQCPFPDDPFHISAVKIISPNERRIAQIKGREKNIAFLKSLTKLEEIPTDSELGENLSFHVSSGFCVVRT